MEELRAEQTARGESAEAALPSLYEDEDAFEAAYAAKVAEMADEDFNDDIPKKYLDLNS